MKNIRLNLFGKLLILAGSIELLMIVVAFFGFSTFNVLNERDKVREAETVMLRCYHFRTEFSKRRDTTFRDKFYKKIREFERILKPYSSEEDFKEILAIKKDYACIFQEYVDSMKTRGLNENRGVEGTFRKRVHDVEDIIKTTNQYTIYTDMLQARRSEKDYIMRRRGEYIKKVDKAINSLITNARTLRIEPRKRDSIIALSAAYRNAFYKMVEIFQKLDDLQLKIEMIEDELQTKLERIVKKEAIKAEISQNIQMIIGAFSLAMGALLAIAISRGITNPVEKLQKAALQIAEGNFETRVKVDTKDEIGLLAEYFNKMASNVETSHKTILVQQEQLKEQNFELELLADDLRASINNLSALSDVGQSITSALEFNEIFGKLQSHLSGLIDASLLGVAMYDENVETLEYKLLIKEGGSLETFKTDISDSARLDAQCVRSGGEILISDYADKSAIGEKYDFLDPEIEYKIIDPESRTLFYLPIKIENQIVGLMILENYQTNAYKSHHLNLLRNLASYVAIALLNAQSYEEITKSHHQLRKTQAQLIQAEKLASLGQLTTGIAHEIKNPLNFINNYADGVVELCGELTEEFGEKIKFSDEDIAYYKTTLDEIAGHLQTINKNGKRIDRIVKTMMEHSRGSASEKTETSLNSFVEEYVKLAYHGFKGQYAGFIANMVFDFVDGNPKVDMRQQDISRVITNIVDNACYSAMKKKEKLGEGFRPEIISKTKELGDSVEIRIRDNGLGIPDKIVNKAFNPFFTTKPTGEGTGLGLSLSYDVVANGHGGSIKIETKIDEYAEFIIELPKK